MDVSEVTVRSDDDVDMDSKSVTKEEEEEEMDFSDNDENGDNEAELMESMPLILKQLKEAGQLASYKKFCRLIAEGRYPTRNIAGQLFLDTAEYFSSTYTSQMQYKYPDTIKYWKTFYKDK